MKLQVGIRKNVNSLLFVLNREVLAIGNLKRTVIDTIKTFDFAKNK